MANLVLALCLTGSAAEQREVFGEPEIPRAKLVNAMRFLDTVELHDRGENNGGASRVEPLAFVRQENLSANAERTRYPMTTQPDFSEKSTECRTAAIGDGPGVLILSQALGCRAAPGTSAVPK